MPAITDKAGAKCEETKDRAESPRSFVALKLWTEPHQPHLYTPNPKDSELVSAQSQRLRSLPQLQLPAQQGDVAHQRIKITLGSFFGSGFGEVRVSLVKHNPGYRLYLDMFCADSSALLGILSQLAASFGIKEHFGGAVQASFQIDDEQKLAQWWEEFQTFFQRIGQAAQKPLSFKLPNPNFEHQLDDAISGTHAIAGMMFEESYTFDVAEALMGDNIFTSLGLTPDVSVGLRFQLGIGSQGKIHLIVTAKSDDKVLHTGKKEYAMHLKLSTAELAQFGISNVSDLQSATFNQQMGNQILKQCKEQLLSSQSSLRQFIRAQAKSATWQIRQYSHGTADEHYLRWTEQGSFKTVQHRHYICTTDEALSLGHKRLVFVDIQSAMYTPPSCD